MATNTNHNVLTMTSASPVDRVNKINTIGQGNVDEQEKISVLTQNKNFNTFKNYTSKIEGIIDKQGIVSLKNPGLQSAFFGYVSDEFDHNYIPLITDKAQRLWQYRNIAEFPECNWCINEIASDFLTVSSTGEFIRLNFAKDISEKLSQNVQNMIQKEFDNFIKLFDIRNNIVDIIRTYVIEGEVCWENIINHEIPSLGIIGVKRLRNDFYDILINQATGENCGIYFDLEKYAQELQYTLSAYYNQNATIFNTIYSNGFRGLDFSSAQNVVPLLFPQITYFSHDKKSPNGRTTYSIIEGVKQAYYQLVLLQDAAVILRVTRAPQRLLFNVSTGGMAEKVAADYVRRFVQKLNEKKVAKIDRQSNNSMISKTYNPSSMLDSWVFPKSNANDGTTVSTVESTAQYDQIEDLKYFLKRMIKQFGVPYTRYDNLESNSYRASTEITQEEFSFSKLELGIQMKFAKALFDTFVVHLKLRGMWTQNKLTENDFYVEFTPPYVYSKFISNQEITQKMELYAKYADREEFSKTWAMKNILGLTDAEIDENNKSLLFDKIIAALGEGIGEKYMGGEFNADQATKLKTMSMSSLEEILANNILNKQKINVTTAEEENGEGGEGGDAGGKEEDNDMGGMDDDMGGGEEDDMGGGGEDEGGGKGGDPFGE